MDENSIPQQRPRNNLGFLPKSNGDSKWETWLRVALSFALGVFSSAFFLGGKSRDISELMEWKGDVAKQFVTVFERLDRMDRDGTNRSRWTDDNQQQQITANRAALAALEQKSEQRGEAINVMQGKLERLDSEIQRDKQIEGRK